jgi:hypothetical protein
MVTVKQVFLWHVLEWQVLTVFLGCSIHLNFNTRTPPPPPPPVEDLDLYNQYKGRTRSLVCFGLSLDLGLGLEVRVEPSPSNNLVRLLYLAEKNAVSMHFQRGWRVFQVCYTDLFAFQSDKKSRKAEVLCDSKIGCDPRYISVVFSIIAARKLWWSSMHWNRNFAKGGILDNLMGMGIQNLRGMVIQEAIRLACNWQLVSPLQRLWDT